MLRVSIAVAAVVATGVLVFLYCYIYFIKDIGSGTQTDDYSVSHLIAISHALESYEEVYGELPYDERGWEHALYKLRTVTEVGHFNAPEDEMKEAHFDDAHERLVGSDYVYLNSYEKRRIDSADSDTPLIWERDGLRKVGRLVCRLDLAICYKQGKDFNDLKSAKDLTKK